jgi:hypothetical protein
LFKEIYKLSDLFFSLFHSCYICKFGFNISESLDLEALFVSKFGEYSVGAEFTEKIIGNGDSKKRESQ